jgi:hypothetical protein
MARILESPSRTSDKYPVLKKEEYQVYEQHLERDPVPLSPAVSLTTPASEPKYAEERNGDILWEGHMIYQEGDRDFFKAISRRNRFCDTNAGMQKISRLRNLTNDPAPNGITRDFCFVTSLLVEKSIGDIFYSLCIRIRNMLFFCNLK